MTDWRSYDEIAGRYDEVWARRFKAAAAHLLSQVPLRAGLRVLDVGTGTGALPSVLSTRVQDLARVVGCDLSLPMLGRARQAVPGILLVVADAARLPFRSESFDLATANFVLSHLPDYREALREVFRVLARPSAVGVSNWAASTDPYVFAWGDLLGEAIGQQAAARAPQEVAPWESHFAEPENLRGALIEAGFTTVKVGSVDLDFGSSIEEYLADRELSSGGRYGRQILGELEWRGFLGKAREELRRRFGGRVAYKRGIVLATGARV